MPNDHPALEQGALDVPGSSPDAGVHEQTPDPDAGDSSGGSSRTPDNVRGELLRKLEQSNSELRQEIAELKGTWAASRESASAQQTPNVADMPSVQLEALRSQVPENQIAEFEKLLQQKKIDESIASKIDARLQAQTVQQRRVDANKAAYSRWPELHDRNSSLYQMTNAVLNERGNGVDRGPQALLDAANEGGLRLGLTAKRVAASSGASVPDGSAPTHETATRRGQVLSKERASAIAKKLQSALPPGKKFNMERISENAGVYHENQHLITRSTKG